MSKDFRLYTLQSIISLQQIQNSSVLSFCTGNFSYFSLSLSHCVKTLEGARLSVCCASSKHTSRLWLKSARDVVTCETKPEIFIKGSFYMGANGSSSLIQTMSICSTHKKVFKCHAYKSS